MPYPFGVTLSTLDDTLGGIWTRNDQHPAWADLEDATYMEFMDATTVTIMHLIDQLGLGAPPEALHFDSDGMHSPEPLGKGITINLSKGAHDDLMRYKYLPKSVIKYLRDGKAWTAAELAEIEKLLRKGLAKNATLADRYIIKADALAALMSAFDRAGRKLPQIFMPELPVTVSARKQMPAPQPGKEYRLRADKGAPDQPVLPMTNLEEEAIKWAQLHAGEKIATQNQYVIQKVRSLVIEARRGRWTPDELRQALLNQLGEFNRDWRRIAITELAECMSNGYLATLKEGDWVIGQSDGTACEWCREHIHGKVFKVVRAPGDPWREVWIGKTNYGRRKKDWIPCIPAHPNCRCRWQWFNPKFMKVTPDGRIDLKTPEEILMERQALKSFFGRPDVLVKGLDYNLDLEDRLAVLPYYNCWVPPQTLGANKNQIPMLNPAKLVKVREAFQRGDAMPPILVDFSRMILDGHHRWYAALELGIEHVPIIILSARIAEAVDEAGENDDTGAIAQAELANKEGH
jgi:hypothetical protein